MIVGMLMGILLNRNCSVRIISIVTGKFMTGRKRYALILAVGLLLFGYGYHVARPKLVEQYRVTSPDGKMDAVIAVGKKLWQECEPTYVLLAPVGGKPYGGDVLESCYGKGLEVFWNAPRLLTIQYEDMKIYHYTSTGGYPNEGYGYTLADVKLRQVGQ